MGIDIGGTKIEGILIDHDGKPLKRQRIPTEASSGYDHIMDQIRSLFTELTRDFNNDFFVGVCTPGALSAATDRLKNSNTECLIGKPIKEDIETIVGRPILLDNDANCFAQAEAALGAARGYSAVFGVIMGTGVGGGICLNGRVHQGHQYLAGEWGHTILHSNGNLCKCGKRGCVETYISGPALEKQHEELTGEWKTVTDIAKDPPKAWKEEFLENFGMAVSNVVNILDPDIIILGGGVSKVDFLYSEGPEHVEKYCFNETLKTPIVRNELGDSAGVFGAAYLELLSSQPVTRHP